jgi:hypothetical protein
MEKKYSYNESGEEWHRRKYPYSEISKDIKEIINPLIKDSLLQKQTEPLRPSVSELPVARRVEERIRIIRIAERQRREDYARAEQEYRADVAKAEIRRASAIQIADIIYIAQTGFSPLGRVKFK